MECYDRPDLWDFAFSDETDFEADFIQQMASRWLNTNRPAVLEIGCGEAGVLKAFTDRGCSAFGIELEESRLEHARTFMSAELQSGKVAFLNKDIYDVDVEKDIGATFDLVILKDVIEHIPNQEKFMPQLHKFLAPGGSVFFAFPPWCMPYGGHQQVLPGKLASKMPWYHLLPGPLYPLALKLFGVNASGIKTM
ncbi:MAG: class I SAM-dependent methyltransferase, partial [Planctomyces sp.]